MKSRLFILLFIFPLLNTYAEQRKVTFITPGIVRVQYTVGDKLEGNNTGVCVYTSSGVETKHTINGNLEVFSSDQLTVTYSKKADEYIFMSSKKNSGTTLADAFLTVKLKADGNVYQEKITYDEKSAHVEETANGKVTVKDIIKRDTIGCSNRYIASFMVPDEMAIYGLGSQMEDYMNLKGKTVAMWGLAFKPETDDMREATALVLIDLLTKAGVNVRVFDPVAMTECKRRVDDVVTYCNDMYEALLDADALLLVTEWKQFRMPSFGVMKKSMRNALIIDGRNIYDPKELAEAGFEYDAIGC